MLPRPRNWRPELFVCGIVLAGGCSTAELPLPLPRPAVIAWIDAPAPPPPSPKPPKPLAVRPCKAADLTARLGRAGFGAGNFYQAVVLTDISASRCALNALPAVRLLDDGGHGVPEPAVITVGGAAPSPVLLQPNVPPGANGAPDAAGQGLFTLHTATAQCWPVGVANVEIILPDAGGRVTLPMNEGPSMSPGCLHGFLSVEALQPGGPPPTQTSSIQQFKVTIEAPVGATGSRLHYKVVLTNTSGGTLRFVDCPDYTEGLKAAAVWERHQLNCQPVGPMQAGDQVTFAMEMDLSRVRPTSRTTTDSLGWSLDAPWSANSSVTINTAPVQLGRSARRRSPGRSAPSGGEA